MNEGYDRDGSWRYRSLRYCPIRNVYICTNLQHTYEPCMLLLVVIAEQRVVLHIAKALTATIGTELRYSADLDFPQILQCGDTVLLAMPLG
jgi:hypothetical protein